MSVNGALRMAAAMGAGSGDPYFSSVKSLLHFDGTDASTTFTDQTGKTWTAAGAAQLSTANALYGTAVGGFNGTNSQITTPTSTDFTMGSGDFTVELIIKPLALAAGTHVIFYHTGTGGYSWCNLLTTGTALSLYMSSAGTSWDLANNVTVGTLATGNWYKIALSRNGTTLGYYIDGTRNGTVNLSTTAVLTCSGVMVIGGVAAQWSYCYLDEFRITKGVGRYSGASYTTQTAAFPNS
jgi:hypothetical protein